VTTPDLHSTPNGETLEARLADAYAVAIPSHLGARLEQRIAAAIGQWAPSKPARRRVAFGRPSRLVLISALLLVAVATVAAGARLFYVTYPPEVFYPSDGGLTWDRGEVLGLTQVVDGYSLTLERAYADANQAMVAVSVTDVQDRGWSQVGVGVGGATLTDSQGVNWEMATGASAPGSTSAAANSIWYRAEPGPASPGRRAFHVTVAHVSVSTLDGRPDPWHEIAVDASFSFDLTVGGGSEATPGVTAEHDGVTVSLDRVIAAPSTVKLELGVTGSSGVDSRWAPIFSVRHGAQTLNGDMASWQEGSATLTAYTSTGVDDASGDWTVTVSELVSMPTGDDPDAPQVRLQGPWTLQFSMP
jgi:hypothetical protein